ncbi:MAG: NAD(P)-dependent oxidoreductase [Pseudomonadota bacterium]
MKEALLTGGLGFIGRNVVKLLVQNGIKLHMIVRPGSDISEISGNGLINIVQVDLENTLELARKMRPLMFDTVFHIGAIRGVCNIKKSTYWKVNVEATECLAKLALERAAKFIFCSSVGVYGVIPKQLPPQATTQLQPDNFYHYTKVTSEKNLHRLKEKGLHFCIIRPSITYGTNDYGFPFSLINMVDKGIFLNSTSSVKINMVDVESLAQAFFNAAIYKVRNGSAFDICDNNPVNLKQIVDFINQNLKNKNYPWFKKLPPFMFKVGEYCSEKIFKSNAWKARFQLISRDWYYNPQQSKDELKIVPKETIPNFAYVIDWYKKCYK